MGMKLYWSPRSPFVRKVMVVVHEAGLAGRVETEAVRVTATETHPRVMAHNPLGKIPTLMLDDGTAIYDSPVICEYLDTLHDGPPLLPRDPATRLRSRRWEALGDGLAETLLAWLGERFRQQPGQSDSRIAVCRTKLAAILSALEAEAADLDASPFCIGQAAIGAALAYLDFRFGDVTWRPDHPCLAAWHEAFSARPSAVATAFWDELAAAAGPEPGTKGR
ncbi:glutathione S-transferase family protein [Inquilinus sp.]|jgi:glutathione S-transferase|uniref:glutathione S-transferase family protein n=1 Tax=Inquilinus sp. TaxID=1932117 RepID=UPI0037837F8D